jgi:hypothetical protein
MSGLGLGRAKTPAPSERVEESRKIPRHEAYSFCADSARYRVGELYFLHFADVSVFTQPGS